MSFYTLPKDERKNLVEKISKEILSEIKSGKHSKTIRYSSNEDTYIKKAAYQSIGKIFFQHKELQKKIILLIESFLQNDEYRVRQTAINTAGEIGIKNFETIEHFFAQGLLDTHHSVRNAVIGSVKKMGEKNPKPVLKWAKKYLEHPDKEIRREICHGVELRGRTHPQDILPLLKELQFDKTARVRNTLIHVLGQISYKKGCLPVVIADLKKWKNKKLVVEAVEEIIDVHERYKNFSAMNQTEARKYIEENL